MNQSTINPSRILSFTVRGTQEDIAGSPLPKVRLTKRQQWSPLAQRYAKWKAHVQEAFLKSLIGNDYAYHVRLWRTFGKPIRLSDDERAVMDISIFWRNGRHGDPENIFGSIADALFCDDKRLDGSFKSQVAEDERGKVEIRITIIHSENADQN